MLLQKTKEVRIIKLTDCLFTHQKVQIVFINKKKCNILMVNKFRWFVCTFLVMNVVRYFIYRLQAYVNEYYSLVHDTLKLSTRHKVFDHKLKTLSYTGVT